MNKRESESGKNEKNEKERVEKRKRIESSITKQLYSLLLRLCTGST